MQIYNNTISTDSTFPHLTEYRRFRRKTRSLQVGLPHLKIHPIVSQLSTQVANIKHRAATQTECVGALCIKEGKKMCNVYHVMNVGQRNKLQSPTVIEPITFRNTALTGVTTERRETRDERGLGLDSCMTCVLHTAWINNVESVIRGSK